MQMLVAPHTLDPADVGAVAGSNSCFVPSKDIDESLIVVHCPPDQYSGVIRDWNIGSEPRGLHAGMPVSRGWDVSWEWKSHGRVTSERSW